MLEQAAEAVAALPGVQLASVSGATPFFGSVGHRVHVPGRDSIPTHSQGGPYIHVVGPDYFKLLDLRIVQGRGLEAQDTRGATPVAVVNETMARYLWPGPEEEAVGRCIQIGGAESQCARVVGVVEEGRRQSLQEDPSLQYYVSVAQRLVPTIPEAVLVRTTGGTDVAAAVRRRFVEANSAIRFVRVQMLRDAIEPQTRPWKLGAAMFGVFGILAVIVAGIGLYSVLAFIIAQRRRELGIRAALGASPSRLIGLAIFAGMRVAGGGIAAGLVVALATAPVIRTLLFRVSPRDPLIFAGAAVGLSLVAVVASTIPGWRAAHVDPTDAILAE